MSYSTGIMIGAAAGGAVGYVLSNNRTPTERTSLTFFGIAAGGLAYQILIGV